ncbi:hypothetical protein FEM48_Zijuj02G0045000 [Ziziphus jujuba var. spinosa]|uniref:Uncharacterized protein n=1 Tax=Ziziphus jujuba var. spinosa TaxID=714518 RepID=A0A978VTM7_ZIZJJ|nr:hypothetical protein FEM48_Zijuj02G0045000 [Ziziphus jujuba var. spinosa]
MFLAVATLPYDIESLLQSSTPFFHAFDLVHLPASNEAYGTFFTEAHKCINLHNYQGQTIFFA